MSNTNVTTVVAISLEAALEEARKVITRETNLLRAKARQEEKLAREVAAVAAQAAALGVQLPQNLQAPTEARDRLAALEAVDPEAKRAKVVRELTRQAQGQTWGWRVRRAIDEGRLPQFDQIDSFVERLRALDEKKKK